MKMTVSIMGPNTNFKQWKTNFLTFLSIKAAYLIPQLAIKESGVWLDEATQNYPYAMIVHVAIENKRVDQAIKCVSTARHDCAKAASDIMCEIPDGRSLARSLSLLDNVMLR
jgi:hypothetical protein